MSDEPDTPDEGDAEEAEDHVDLDSASSVFYVNVPEKAKAEQSAEQVEESEEMMRALRDQFFEIPLVTGVNTPNFSFEASQCDKGCHTYLWVVDANNDDEHYLLQQMPSFVAQMSGLVDFNGNVNPQYAKTEIKRRQSVLN